MHIKELSQKMNSKERVRIAMSGGVPDIVPVVPQICHPHAIRVLGMDFKKTVVEALENPFLVNKVVLDCVHMYGVDGIRVWIPDDPISIIDDGEDAWQLDENTGKKIGRVDFMGGGGVIPLEEKSILKDKGEVEKIEVLSAEELLKTDKFQSIKEIVDDAGTELFITGVPAPFTFQYATLMRGKQQAMIDLIERPDFVKKIIDKGTQIAIQESIAFVKIGVDALYLGETFGGIIGPRYFEEFCVPAFKRFVRILKEYNVLMYLD